MTDTLVLADDPGAARARVAEVLGEGGVAVLPAEGVYAIVADAFNATATQRIFGARRRSRAVPLPVVIRSPRQVSGLVSEVIDPADRLMAAYWPGPLTVIFPASDGLTWDLGDTRGTVQLRLPRGDLLIDLAKQVGPLACTSANRLGKQRPTNVADAREMLGSLVQLYVDGGERDGVVSTVVDVTRGRAEVRRVGAISREHVLAVAGGSLAWGARPDGATPAAAGVTDADADTTDADATDATEADATAVTAPPSTARDAAGDQHVEG